MDNQGEETTRGQRLIIQTMYQVFLLVWVLNRLFSSTAELTSPWEVPADEAYEQERLRFAEITDEI